MKSERIKVLLTEDSLPLGGAETQMLQLLKHLNRRIFDVHLMTLRRRGQLLSEAQTRADHYACANRRTSFDPAALYRIRKYVVRNSISIVHSNQWLDALYSLIACRGLKIKRVATVHGYAQGWRQSIHLWVLRHFDRVICVSRSLKLDLYKLGLPWEKLAVVNNCYDDEKFTVATRTRKEEPGPFHIVMVGNFMWWKDQRTLIEAAGLLRKEGHNLEVCLVGGKTSRFFELCTSLIAKMGLQDVIRVVENQRVDGSFLGNFDLFVFSSLADTFGIALLEAMVSGLPVLVSNIPSSMELIGYGEHGIYFETGNASSCAEQIAKLIENRDLRCLLSQKAYRRAQDFRPEKVMRDLEDVYMDLARGLS